MRFFIYSVLLLATLPGCGQTGPLYIPQAPAPPAVEPAG